MTKTYECTHIIWDKDGARISLPRKVFVSIEITSETDLGEEISDAITKGTGFCHKGFFYTEIKSK